MTRILLLLATFLPVFLSAQIHIDKTKEEVKAALAGSGKDLRIIETDTTIILAPSRDVEEQQATWTYGFDRNGKCEYARLTSNCGTCFEKELQSLLSQPFYQWKKINENQFVSKFEDKLLLETSPDDDQYFFKVMRANWSREIYDMLKSTQ